mgnify:CR=1 FL=1
MTKEKSKKKFDMKSGTFVLAVRFIQYLILLDLQARPMTGIKGPRPPYGLSRSKCLAMVEKKKINILRLTIPLIVTKDASEITRLGDMAETLLAEDQQTTTVDVQLLLKEAQEKDAEWVKILQLFASEAIKPDDILAKR